MLKPRSYLSMTIILSLIHYTNITHAAEQNRDSIMIELGSLMPDNSMDSKGQFISADGRFVSGSSTIPLVADGAFFYDIEKESMISLNSSFPNRIYGMSEDGNIIVGYFTANDIQAFYYRQDSGEFTNIGTLRSDNSGSSWAKSVSGDGRIIVGYASDDSSGAAHAFRYNIDEGKMTNLGDLTLNNSGYSSANAASYDGRVVIGISSIEDGLSNEYHAFRHNEGDAKMTDLGTLRQDNKGASEASAVSADGRVVIGNSDTDFSTLHAFRHNEGDAKMTDLGTLSIDNTGTSSANAISADGRVVVGYASTDAGTVHAFLHYEGDSKMVDLGTLQSDNSGTSYANAISANGKVIVGESDGRAFKYVDDNKKIALLSSLVGDDGYAAATAVSSDGAVIIGYSESNSGYTRGVVWKTEKAVEVANTYFGMDKTASKAAQVMDLYQHTLDMMVSTRCEIGQDEYCIGLYGQYNNVHDNSYSAAGIYGSMKLGNEKWRIGGAIDVANNVDLVHNYDVNGTDIPAIALQANFQDNQDGSGLKLALGAAYMKHELSISREQLPGSESGVGDTHIKGYLAAVEVGYGFNIQRNTQLTPLIGLKHYSITRNSYSEDRNADFLASYDSLTNRNTDLQLGLKLQYQLSNQFSFDGAVGSYINLFNHRDDFRANLDYFGEQEKHSLSSQSFKGYANLGTSFAITKNSTLRASAGWSETDYRRDAMDMTLSYSYHF